jgi:site-specific DNA recombinase
MTLCAIYARVSDESQLKGDSIEHQISYCKEHARRRSLDDGVQWIAPESFMYVDEGITGTSMVKPGCTASDS